jgi:hypothetical protein
MATPREIQEMIALTYGMITNIDDRIGMVMDDLARVRRRPQHGGDLHLGPRRSARRPWHRAQGAVALPGAGARALHLARARRERGGRPARRDDLVSSLDLPTSILARAGIASPNGSQGKTLVRPQSATRCSTPVATPC